MIADDHYIPNEMNAHIDTASFEADIYKEVKVNRGITDEKLVELIYKKVFSRIAVPPNEPDDAALICRYLTPDKFIQFLDTKEIAFPAANQFSDKWECAVPEDYNNAVLAVFEKIGRSGEVWASYVMSQASTWNVSCWTELESYFDDHLLWSTYAGGHEGVGITIRYGQFKSHFIEMATGLDVGAQPQQGRINYQSISLLPFNKHYIFRNEKEIRFAFKSCCSMLEVISVNEIFDLFGIRISPAAEIKHCEMIREKWLECGGSDRIQHPS